MQRGTQNSFAPALALVCLLVPVACGDDAAVIDAGPDPACLEAEGHADLAWIQEKIFTPTCAAFSVCHQGRALQAEGLNLEDGESYGELVGQASALFPDKQLVVPGDPEARYLMTAVGQYPGELGPGGTMPFNNPLLCVEKRDAMQRWIEQGALGTQSDAGVDAGPVDAGPGDAAPTDAPL